MSAASRLSRGTESRARLSRPATIRLSLIVAFDCHGDNLSRTRTWDKFGHPIVSSIVTGWIDCHDGRQSIDDDRDNRGDYQERRSNKEGSGGRKRPTLAVMALAREVERRPTGPADR